MFEPSPAGLCISPVRDLDDNAQHGIMSPIPFEGISPEGAVGGMAQPKFVDSPGFSPIRPPKTPIRKIMRRSQEESYLQGIVIVVFLAIKPTPVSGIVPKAKKYVFSQLKQ